VYENVIKLRVRTTYTIYHGSSNTEKRGKSYILKRLRFETLFARIIGQRYIYIYIGTSERTEETIRNSSRDVVTKRKIWVYGKTKIPDRTSANRYVRLFISIMKYSGKTAARHRVFGCLTRFWPYIRRADATNVERSSSRSISSGTTVYTRLSRKQKT